MVIVLIDGGVILPKGSTEADTIGIRIEINSERHIIPYNQIKWIYENTDPEKEQLFARQLMAVKAVEPIKPIKNKSSEEMVSELYK